MAGKRSRSDPGAVGCVCMRVRKVARVVTQIYDQHLKDLGLTITQFGVLSHIARHDHIGIAPLATMLLMDPTALARNLAPLQRRGLVAVLPDPADRRTRHLHLTAKGSRLLADARPAWEMAQRQIIDALGAGAASELNATLDHALGKLGDGAAVAPRP